MRAKGALFAVALLALACCRGDPKSSQGTGSLPPEPLVIAVGGARIELQIEDGAFALTHAEIERWVKDAAVAVTAYFGKFPVEHTTVDVRRSEGRRVGDGETRGFDGFALIRINLGASAAVRDLERDWVLTHEMVHLGMPDLPEPNHWLEEGLATYVEPIARAQAGQESAEDVWRQLVLGLPQGEPAAGDQGLDRTPTWGRTYWGGALFCLLADVEIRERTHGRFGFQDAARALVADGRTILTWSPIDRVLETCDAAVGVPVLSELYARHARQAEPVDLELLWRRLGIVMPHRRLTFDDTAPLAETRKAITAPR